MTMHARPDSLADLESLLGPIFSTLSGLPDRPRHPIRRVLLLQGPVGPFFRELQNALDIAGVDTLRIGFNRADGPCFGSVSRARYRRHTGSPATWPHDAASILAEFRPDMVILFGAERPAHSVMRAIAERRNIPVLCLEEGYIRPGFITAEYGGTNAESPLAYCAPEPHAGVSTLPSGTDFRAFRHMARHAFVYYALRTLFASPGEAAFFHRRFAVRTEISGWAGNLLRRTWNCRRDRRVIDRLTGPQSGSYYLAALQVPGDSNLGVAAMGWTTASFIEASIASFAAHAPAQTRLVFKVHPLARGRDPDLRLIPELARSFGIASRIDILESGSIGMLAHSARGLLTINSTSGLSAIAHGTPLLAAGRSIYTHRPLAWTAPDPEAFNRFWTEGRAAPGSLRLGFLDAILSEALLAGDFYAPAGRRAALCSMLSMLRLPIAPEAAMCSRTRRSGARSRHLRPGIRTSAS